MIPHPDRPTPTSATTLIAGNQTPPAETTGQWEVRSAGSIDVTGLTGGRIGRGIVIENTNPLAGGLNMTFKHNDGGAPGGGKFFCIGAADIVVAPGEMVTCRYSATQAAWFVE